MSGGMIPGHPSVIERADRVSEVQEVKHAYRKEIEPNTTTRNQTSRTFRVGWARSLSCPPWS
jgi:hypothetical protein